jgi:hypothetical protein
MKKTGFTLLSIFLITTLLQAQQNNFKKGDHVLVTIYVANEATILEAANGKYKVHYEDIDSEDAWVQADKVTAIDRGNTTEGPPAGIYICYQPKYEYAYMGSFVLNNKNAYQYLTGNKGKGNYKYNAATSSITWQGGDLAGKVIATEYTNTKQNGPMIKLVFPKGKRVGDIQTCRLKK